MRTRWFDPRKNLRLPYFLKHVLLRAIPDSLYRALFAPKPAGLSPLEAAAVVERILYYNKVRAPFELPASASRPRYRDARRQRNYYLDILEHLRCFDPSLRINYSFGDTTLVPDTPTFVKARPIEGANENSILLNLNKIRHFTFVRDRQPFETKRDRVVWRGRAGRANRQALLAAFFDHPLCDVGDAGRIRSNSPWCKPYLSITEQLRYKFVLSIEGNDVASNLKWILSSNSLCLMPRPRFETWFMEGRLVPNVHYVLLEDHCADLEDKVHYFTRHTEEALRIIRHAQAWVAQFRDLERESLIAYCVLQKFFEDSGQLERIGRWAQMLE